MKQVILGLILGIGLAVAFIGYASVSMAGGSNVDGSYTDTPQNSSARP